MFSFYVKTSGSTTMKTSIVPITVSLFIDLTKADMEVGKKGPWKAEERSS